MVSQACLIRCRENLLNKKEALWREAAEAAVRSNSIRKKDFDQDSSEFYRELQKAECIHYQKRYEFERTVIRLSKIENGTFKGVCPDCGGNMNEEDLELNPLMERCSKCQEALNHRKKRR
jgi:RNA polymerase-binding transcription factor DksA